MIAHKQYQAYAAATQTVAKTQQIVLLYDAAIRNLRQAQEAEQARNIEERFRLLLKASDILSGLQGCLDFEQGGEIAHVLYQFYLQMDLKIFALHRNPSPDAFALAIDELKQMRDVWAEIDRNDNAAVASPAEPSVEAENVAVPMAPPNTAGAMPIDPIILSA